MLEKIDRWMVRKKDYSKNRNRICGFTERIRSLRQRPVLLPPISRRHPSGKASSDTSFCSLFCSSLCGSFYGSFCSLKGHARKASLAVETAVVLPFFFVGVVSMISFMDIYKIETEHLAKLCQAAKKAGMYAYTSQGGPDEITLPDIYSYKPVGGLIPLPVIWMHNTVKVHAWTGREYQTVSEGTAVEPMVYVTESGGVFHKTLGCTYLDLSVTQVSGTAVNSLKNDYGAHYTACESCSRGQAPAGTVYITEKGTHYHNQEGCSGLKRSVRLVKESDVGNMCACSRCGG